MNVVSVRGGKVHENNAVDGHPFPLCRTGGMSNQGTRYQFTDAPLSCKTCIMYEERRAAKAAEESANVRPPVKVTAFSADDEPLSDESLTSDDDDSVDAFMRDMAERDERVCFFEVFRLGADGYKLSRTVTRSELGVTGAAERGTITDSSIPANTEESDMAAKTTASAAPDVDELTSAVHDIIDQLKSLKPDDEGAAETAAALYEEGDAKIRQLPTNRRTTLRNELTDARDAIVKPSAPAVVHTGTIVPRGQAEDPEEYEGVPELIQQGVKTFRAGVKQGLKLVGTAEEIARIIINARTHVPNPATGLPDLIADRKTTKNIAEKIYKAAEADVAQDDVTTQAAGGSLKRAIRNKLQDVLPEFIRAMDNPASAEVFESLFPAAAESVRKRDELRAAMEADPEVSPEDIPPALSPSEALYELYESKGIRLPRKTRTELERERKRAEALLNARRELVAAKDIISDDDADDDERKKAEAAAAKLEEKIKNLEEVLPADVLEKVEQPAGKTPQERALEKTDKVGKLVEQVGKTVKRLEGSDRQHVARRVLGTARDAVTAVTEGTDKLSEDERADLRSELESLMGAIAAKMASL